MVRRRLAELRVTDLGVIDDVTIELHEGMTALTGETGAGKTLVVGALGLLLGGRADPSVVRHGAKEARVEGRFVAEAGSEEDDVVLARTVAIEGRSRAWINGQMATLSTLAETAATLVELHGQHLHRTLVTPDAQRAALDRFGEIDLHPLTEARRHLEHLLSESRTLGGDAVARAKELDLLAFQIAEIDAAGVDGADEDARLEAEEDRLAAASGYREAAAAALAAVSEREGANAQEHLAEASGALGGKEALAALDERVRLLMSEVTELSAELRTVVETWEDDPGRLEEIRARRRMLRDLARKYGGDLEATLTYAIEARARIEALSGAEIRAAALDNAIAEAHAHVALLAAQVAEERRRLAPELAHEIESTLHALAMPSARFAIEVDGPDPGDDVRFLLGANVGEDLQPVAKTASGGELARTMLAVRLAITDAPGVMLFDEVDAGVGGEAATAVGVALAALGRSSQVVVVTHLPQVAAQADHQLLVRKVEERGRTASTVTRLDPDARVVEISRMLSGRPDSESAREHARELLQRNENETLA